MEKVLFFLTHLLTLFLFSVVYVGPLIRSVDEGKKNITIYTWEHYSTADVITVVRLLHCFNEAQEIGAHIYIYTYIHASAT